MSLFERIQDLMYNTPIDKGILTGLTFQLTSEQFKDFVVEVNKQCAGFIPELIDWSTYDITKPIKFMISGGRSITINIKEL